MFNRVFPLLIVLLGAMLSAASGHGRIPENVATWAENDTVTTTCAEEDNVNIPVFAENGSTDYFQIVATHPTYTVSDYSCTPDFSGCSAAAVVNRSPNDTCLNLWDDGTNVVRGCTVPDWWRPYSMTISVGAVSGNYHYLVLHRKIQGVGSWPEFLVLYADGNMRLIPHPPVGATAVCYGTSVILGPAADVGMERPYADIQQITVDPPNLALDIRFRDGGDAHVDLAVDRDNATAHVAVDYPVSSTNPFAIFRSMYVAENNADAAAIQSPASTEPVIGPWTTLAGPWWFLHRTAVSNHNQSAPDITILTGKPTLTASTNLTDVQLTWQDETPKPPLYAIHRSPTPYFAATGSTLETTTTAGAANWLDSGILNNPDNLYYRVLRLSGNGLPDVPANDIGVFRFAVTAGN